jgi:hypothetical protein
MKKTKQVSKKVYNRRVRACAKAPTLEQVLQTAVVVPLTARPKLDLKPGGMPGDPTCRSIMASVDYTDKQVERVFKDNPTSLWIVTPFEVIERGKFFAAKREAAKQMNPGKEDAKTKAQS